MTRKKQQRQHTPDLEEMQEKIIDILKGKLDHLVTYVQLGYGREVKKVRKEIITMFRDIIEDACE